MRRSGVGHPHKQAACFPRFSSYGCSPGYTVTRYAPFFSLCADSQLVSSKFRWKYAPHGNISRLSLISAPIRSSGPGRAVIWSRSSLILASSPHTISRMLRADQRSSPGMSRRNSPSSSSFPPMLVVPVCVRVPSVSTGPCPRGRTYLPRPAQQPWCRSSQHGQSDRNGPSVPPPSALCRSECDYRPTLSLQGSR